VAPSEPPPPSKVAASEPPPTHSVAINATPWASIEVDGRALGETPIAGIELEEGRHRFRARMPDGSVREQLLQIDADHRYVVFE
jgi:hypothetical protein